MPLENLINDLFDDVRAPGVLWQIGLMFASMLLGWFLARMVRASILRRHAMAATPVNHRFESLVRVLAPFIVVVFLALSKYFLAKSQPVHLLSVALPLASSLAVIRFGFYLLRRVFSRHGQVSADMLTFEKIFALLVWLAVALYITGLWPDLFEFLDNTTLPLGRNKVSVATILQAAVSVAVLLMLALWAGASLEERLMGMPGLHSSLRAVLARMARAVLILVSVLVSLSLVGIDLTVLSVFGGAFGVALGFGLQKIAANFVSGFIILLDRSLTIGDMITVGQFSGKVTQINTRYTVLLGGDGVESIVPNEMLISGGVQNMSLSNRMVWLSATVSVGYETDIDVIFPLLEAATASVPRVSKSKPPSATLVRFGADGLDLQIGFWISDPENGTGGVKSNVNRAIWRTLQEHKVSVPFPQRELRIIGAPPTALTGVAEAESTSPGMQP